MNAIAQTNSTEHAEPTQTIDDMIQELNNAKAHYLEARADLNSVVDQMERNQRSLDAAQAEATQLNQEWRDATHRSGMKASGEVRKLIDASMAARDNAERMAMLVEEGPNLRKEKQEQTATLRKSYLQKIDRFRGPILASKAEAATRALKEAGDFSAAFSDINEHLANLYQSFLKSNALHFNVRTDLSAWESEIALMDHARKLTLTKGLVPLLETLGLDLEADIPEDLRKMRLLSVEKPTTWD